MKMIGIVLSLIVAPTLVAQTLVCFTKSEPAMESSVRMLEDREVYITTEEEGIFSVQVVTKQEKGPVTSCSIAPGIGINLSLLCGNDVITLDRPNQAGIIQRVTDEVGVSYTAENMLCRNIEDLLHI